MDNEQDYEPMESDEPEGWDWVMSRVKYLGKERELENLAASIQIFEVLDCSRESIEAVRALYDRLEKLP